MDAHEIKDRLASQAEAVCLHLLPAGKRRGREWIVGDLSNTPGTSLKVELEGAKAGVWRDFAADVGGSNLLELWRARRGVDFPTAVREAKEWLGVPLESRNGQFYAKPAAAPPKPVAAEFGRLAPDGPARRYLEQERGISSVVLERYRVGQTKAGNGYVFPSYSADGKRLEMWKAIGLERTPEGKKKTYTSKDSAKALFGKHAVAEHAGQLVITEGEIDALSVAEIGGYAVSVPYGAKGEDADGRSPNDAWIEHDWEWLEQFTTIVLCFDADEEGAAAALCILKRLGRERCRLVTLPKGCKDANECLQTGRREELGKAILEARSLDPDELRNAGDYRDAVWEKMHPPGGIEPGRPFFLPLAFRVRPGELSIWTGYNGAGKSAFLTHLMVDLAAKGERICIGSFEMPPAHTLHMATRQAANTEKIDDKKQFTAVMDWLGERMWLFDRDNLRDWREMLEVFTYARRRYNIGQFVVDSLAKCGIPTDDYNGQKAFVDTLVTWAKNEGVHVHLVAHSRKRDSEKEASTKMDVKGASEITDLAWNVATIWRNKAKEKALWEATNNMNQTAYAEAMKMIDGKVEFSKQRATGAEPWTNLFFDRMTLRFRTQEHTKEVPYV